jgi:hypothetical protein
VLGYEDYEVSDLGRVRSIERVITRRNGSPMPYKSQIISPFRSPPTNYWTVTLKMGGQKRNRRIHVLVAEAFIGPRPPGLEVCHNNNDQDDNRPINLRWDTHRSNMQDKAIFGTHHNALKTHCKRGHEFTPENTRMTTTGGRQCRRCIQDRMGVKNPYGPRT